MTLFFILFIACILSHSQTSLLYAAKGLDLWFYKMIPALLPFMILSGTMVRLSLTEKVAMLIHPLLKPLYKASRNVSYGMLTGFLCGFPMGAKVTADLYSRKMITHREAEFLLTFCNNIGPVYFCSFALPLLGMELTLPYLFGMYGLPLLYGLLLRHTLFRDLGTEEKPKLSHPELMELSACAEKRKKSLTYTELLSSLNDAIKSAMESIFSLGGYMILFNLLNILPHILLGRESTLLAPIFEITGGLSTLGDTLPLYSLLMLSFGGLSCLAQTYSCISSTDLSFGSYVRHKCILTLLNALYYLGWFVSFPECFLR